MMDLLSLDQSWLMLLLFFAAIALCHLMIKMHFRRLDQKMAADLKALAQTVAVIEQSSVGLGRNLQLIERNVRALSGLHDQFESRPGAESLYLQAAQVAGMGATTADLMNNFGLSRVEAKLIETLHATRAGAGLH